MELLELHWETLEVETAQDERCGIVLRSGEILELQNSSTYPYNSFVISNVEIEPYKAEIAASWHTHPRGPHNLSIDDYNTFMDMPEIPHLIITHKSVSMYQSDGQYVMNLGRRHLHGNG
jgi:proteasome lid subunit RPN8/RPN11